MGCQSRIEGVAGNGGGGWYFPPPDPDESNEGKGGMKRVRTSAEDLVDIVSQSFEGGNAMHKREGGYLIIVNKEQYGIDGESDNRRLLLIPEPERYLSHLRSLNEIMGREHKGGPGKP